MTEIYQEIQLHQKALWEETLKKNGWRTHGDLLEKEDSFWDRKWPLEENGRVPFIAFFLFRRAALLSFIDRENCNNPQVIDWTFNAPFYFGLFSMQLLSKRPKKQRYKCCPQYLQGRIKRYFLHLLHKNFTWHTVRNLM